MNEWLAQMYGTNGANSEEQEKVASLDLFAKLAAQHNIDLSQLSDQQVSELYASTFPEFAKTAEEDEDKADEDEEEEEEEKKESAAHYVQEKLAFQEKFAEADLMGRVMAHAFVQEREEIEKEAAASQGKGLERIGKKVVNLVGRTGGAEQAMNPRTAKAIGAGTVAAGGVAAGGAGYGGYKALSKKKEAAASQGKGLERIGKKVVNLVGRTGGAEQAMNPRTAKAIGAGTVGTGAVAAGGAGYGGYKALKGKEKKSSAEAFEEMAADQAVKIASAAGFDSDEAFDRVNAVYILGLQETEKIASVQNVDDALHIRGLEYLEVAGYPVDWSEIYGE